MTTRPTTDELNGEVLPSAGHNTPLDYASPRPEEREFLTAGGRQFLFAVGVCLCVFGLVYAAGGSRAWDDGSAAITAAGAGIIALMLRWPGCVGGRRHD